MLGRVSVRQSGRRDFDMLDHYRARQSAMLHTNKKKWSATQSEGAPIQGAARCQTHAPPSAARIRSSSIQSAWLGGGMTWRRAGFQKIAPKRGGYVARSTRPDVHDSTAGHNECREHRDLEGEMNVRKV